MITMADSNVVPLSFVGNTFKVDLKVLHISLHGPAAVFATTATFGVGSYVVYRVVNNEEYMRAILQPFQDLGGIIRAWRGGSVVLEVVAENEEVANRIKEACETGEILKQINERLDTYEEKYKKEIGRFDKTEILKEEDLQMSEEEWNEAKINLEKKFQCFASEDDNTTSNDSMSSFSAESHAGLRHKLYYYKSPVAYENDTTIDSRITETISMLKCGDSKSTEAATPKSTKATDPKSTQTDDPVPKASADKQKVQMKVKPSSITELDKYLQRVLDPEHIKMLQGATNQEKVEFATNLIQFRLYEAAGWNWELPGQGKKMGKLVENTESISTYELYQLADKLKSQNSFCEAVVFFYLAYERARKEFKDEMTGRVTSLCLRDIADVMKKLLERGQHKIIKDHLMRVVDWIFDDYKANTKKQEMNEDYLWCAHWRALSYILTRDWESCFYLLTEVLPPVDTGDIPAMSRVLGYCYTNLGYSYYKMRDYISGGEFYTKAVAAFEKATDFVSEEEKMRHVKIAERGFGSFT